MMNAYKEGKDLYATIAKGVYHMDYWDCMEHHEDGTPNPEGKKRRASCKAILLGIMYGRGANAIAEQIGSTKEVAQGIVDDFYKSFPQVKSWMDESLANLQKNQYVEDFYGRRRRLTDVALPNYEIKVKNTTGNIVVNPFLICKNKQLEDPRIAKWQAKIQEKIEASQAFQMKKAKEEHKSWEPNGEMSNAQYEKLAKEALKDGIVIQANTGRKAQATRQCVNARIQGGAATMTKIAMNKITADSELAKYGFKMCIGVHDELIGQCKEEYATQCADRLCEIMKTCVSDIVTVPFKCDPSIVHKWYEDEMAFQLQEDYQKLIIGGMSAEKAKEVISTQNSEFLPEQITELLTFVA